MDTSPTLCEERPGDDSTHYLQTIREAAEGTDKSLLANAWTLARTPEAMDLLADDWADDTQRKQLTTLFSILEAIPGCVSKSRSLRKAIEGLADSRKTAARIDDLEQTLADTTIARALGDSLPPEAMVSAPILADLRVPRGYQIGPNGVFKLAAGPDGEMSTTRITATPILVVGRTVDVLSGQAYRQVIWLTAHGWVSRVVDRRLILDSRQILGLASFEAPVSSNSAGQVVSWLSEFEAENLWRFHTVQTTPRMGWQPDGSFMLPDQHYAMSGAARYKLVPPDGQEHVSNGWLPGGTWDDWIQAVNEVTEYPYMMIAIYASAASPLLELFGLSGFVVDFCGETSGGKTTALRLAASVWGKPADAYPTAMYSWDATRVWIERTAGTLYNLPLILDETKRVKNPKIIRDVIYDFCQGQGRGRGRPDGTRRSETWRSILLSSGEGSATSYSRDAGTRARVITLDGKPLGCNPAKGGPAADRLQAGIRGNYGHLGRRLAEYLVATSAHHDSLREMFLQWQQHYADVSRNAVARRHAGHLAILTVTAAILHDQLELPAAQCDPFRELLEAAASAGADADQPLIALQDIVSWCSANQNRFWGRHDRLPNGEPRHPHGGWAGVWGAGDDWSFIAVTSLTLRKILEGLGHHPQEIIARWSGRDWIVKSGSRPSRTVRLDGQPTRCYCIRRDAVELALVD